MIELLVVIIILGTFFIKKIPKNFTFKLEYITFGIVALSLLVVALWQLTKKDTSASILSWSVSILVFLLVIGIILNQIGIKSSSFNRISLPQNFFKKILTKIKSVKVWKTVKTVAIVIASIWLFFYLVLPWIKVYRAKADTALGSQEKVIHITEEAAEQYDVIYNKDLPSIPIDDTKWRRMEANKKYRVTVGNGHRDIWPTTMDGSKRRWWITHDKLYSEYKTEYPLLIFDSETVDEKWIPTMIQHVTLPSFGTFIVWTNEDADVKMLTVEKK